MRTSVLWVTIIPALMLACFAFARASRNCGSPSDWDAAEKWFSAQKSAWEQKDVNRAVSLFAPDVEYDEDPFNAPLRGSAQIRQYWEEVARSQRDILVKFEVLSAARGMGIVKWHASFKRVPSGQRVQLEGIAQFFLNSHGQCTRFLEWWNRKQTP